MLDSTTLRELRAWDKSEGLNSVSGPYFMRRHRERHKDTLYIRGLDTPWRAIAESGGCFNGSAEFINADTLAVSYCDTAELIQADGKVLFTARVPKGRLAAHAWGSPDGRFVAVTTRTTGGLPIALAFDMSHGPVLRETLLYDTRTNSLVDSLRYPGSYVAAFSPDSSGFALLSGGILRMFHLPPPEK
jgi:hypothetical protein